MAYNQSFVLDELTGSPFGSNDMDYLLRRERDSALRQLETQALEEERRAEITRNADSIGGRWDAAGVQTRLGDANDRLITALARGDQAEASRLMRARDDLTADVNADVKGLRTTGDIVDVLQNGDFTDLVNKVRDAGVQGVHSMAEPFLAGSAANAATALATRNPYARLGASALAGYTSSLDQNAGDVASQYLSDEDIFKRAQVDPEYAKSLRRDVTSATNQAALWDAVPGIIGGLRTQQLGKALQGGLKPSIGKFALEQAAEGAQEIAQDRTTAANIQQFKSGDNSLEAFGRGFVPQTEEDWRQVAESGFGGAVGGTSISAPVEAAARGVNRASALIQDRAKSTGDALGGVSGTAISAGKLAAALTGKGAASATAYMRDKMGMSNADIQSTLDAFTDVVRNGDEAAPESAERVKAFQDSSFGQAFAKSAETTGLAARALFNIGNLSAKRGASYVADLAGRTGFSLDEINSALHTAATAETLGEAVPPAVQTVIDKVAASPEGQILTQFKKDITDVGGLGYNAAKALFKLEQFGSGWLADRYSGASFDKVRNLMQRLADAQTGEDFRNAFTDSDMGILKDIGDVLGETDDNTFRGARDYGTVFSPKGNSYSDTQNVSSVGQDFAAALHKNNKNEALRRAIRDNPQSAAGVHTMLGEYALNAAAILDYSSDPVERDLATKTLNGDVAFDDANNLTTLKTAAAKYSGVHTSFSQAGQASATHAAAEKTAEKFKSELKSAAGSDPAEAPAEKQAAPTSGGEAKEARRRKRYGTEDDEPSDSGVRKNSQATIKLTYDAADVTNLQNAVKVAIRNSRGGKRAPQKRPENVQSIVDLATTLFTQAMKGASANSTQEALTPAIIGGDKKLQETVRSIVGRAVDTVRDRAVKASTLQGETFKKALLAAIVDLNRLLHNKRVTDRLTVNDARALLRMRADRPGAFAEYTDPEIGVFRPSAVATAPNKEGEAQPSAVTRALDAIEDLLSPTKRYGEDYKGADHADDIRARVLDNDLSKDEREQDRVESEFLDTGDDANDASVDRDTADENYNRDNAGMGVSEREENTNFAPTSIKVEGLSTGIFLDDAADRFNKVVRATANREARGTEGVSTIPLGDYLIQVDASEKSSPGAVLASLTKKAVSGLWDSIKRVPSEGVQEHFAEFFQLHNGALQKELVASLGVPFDENVRILQSEFSFGTGELNLTNAALSAGAVDISQFSAASVIKTLNNAIRIASEDTLEHKERILNALARYADDLGDAGSDLMDAVEAAATRSLLEETVLDFTEGAKSGTSLAQKVSGLWAQFEALTKARQEYIARSNGLYKKDPTDASVKATPTKVLPSQLRSLARGISLIGRAENNNDVLSPVSEEYTKRSLGDILEKAAASDAPQDLPYSGTHILVKVKGRSEPYTLDTKKLVRMIHAANTASYTQTQHIKNRLLHGLAFLMTHNDVSGVSFRPLVVGEDGNNALERSVYPITADLVRKGQLPIPRDAVLLPADGGKPVLTFGDLGMGSAASDIAVGKRGTANVAKKRVHTAAASMVRAELKGRSASDSAKAATGASSVSVLLGGAEDASVASGHSASVKRHQKTIDNIKEQLKGDISVENRAALEKSLAKAQEEINKITSGKGKTAADASAYNAQKIAKGIDAALSALPEEKSRTDAQKAQAELLAVMSNALTKQVEQEEAALKKEARSETGRKIQKLKEVVRKDVSRAIQTTQASMGRAREDFLKGRLSEASPYYDVVSTRPPTEMDAMAALWRNNQNTLDDLREEYEAYTVAKARAEKEGKPAPKDSGFKVDSETGVSLFQTLAAKNSVLVDSMNAIVNEMFPVEDFTGDTPYDMYANDFSTVELERAASGSEIHNQNSDRSFLSSLVQWAQAKEDFVYTYAGDIALRDKYAFRDLLDDVKDTLGKQQGYNNREIRYRDIIARATGAQPAPRDVVATATDVRRMESERDKRDSDLDAEHVARLTPQERARKAAAAAFRDSKVEKGLRAKSNRNAIQILLTATNGLLDNLDPNRTDPNRAAVAKFLREYARSRVLEGGPRATTVNLSELPYTTMAGLWNVVRDGKDSKIKGAIKRAARDAVNRREALRSILSDELSSAPADGRAALADLMSKYGIREISEAARSSVILNDKRITKDVRSYLDEVNTLFEKRFNKEYNPYAAGWAARVGGSINAALAAQTNVPIQSSGKNDEVAKGAAQFAKAVKTASFPLSDLVRIRDLMEKKTKRGEEIPEQNRIVWGALLELRDMTSEEKARVRELIAAEEASNTPPVMTLSDADLLGRIEGFVGTAATAKTMFDAFDVAAGEDPFEATTKRLDSVSDTYKNDRAVTHDAVRRAAPYLSSAVMKNDLTRKRQYVRKLETSPPTKGQTAESREELVSLVNSEIDMYSAILEGRRRGFLNEPAKNAFAAFAMMNYINNGGKVRSVKDVLKDMDEYTQKLRIRAEDTIEASNTGAAGFTETSKKAVLDAQKQVLAAKGEGGLTGGVKKSEQVTGRGDFSPKPVTKETLVAEVDRLLGQDQVKTLFNRLGKDLDASGTFSVDEISGDYLIQIAMDAINPVAVARHEAVHALWKMLGNTNKSVRRLKDRLTRTVYENRAVRMAVYEALVAQDHAIAGGNIGDIQAKYQNILSDREELLAYAFQLYMDGDKSVIRAVRNSDLKDAEKEAGFFVKAFAAVGKFVREVIGVVDSVDQLAMFFDALGSGKFASASKTSAFLESAGRTFGDLTQDKLGPAIRVYDKVVVSGLDRLRESDIPAFRSLASLVRSDVAGGESHADFTMRRNVITNQWKGRLARMQRQYSAKEIEAAYEEYLSGGKPSTPASETFSAFMREVRSQIVTAMPNAATVGSNLPSVVWDLDAIQENRSTFVELLQKKLGMTVAEAEAFTDAATTYGYTSAISTHYMDLNHNRSNAMVPEHFFASVFNKDFAPFFNKDVAFGMDRVLSESAHKLAAASFFGKDYALLDTTWKNAKKEGATDEEIADAKNSLAGAMRVYKQHSLSANMRNAQAGVMLALNMALLPFSLITSQLIDPFAIAAKSGDLNDIWRAYVKGFTHIFNQLRNKEDATEGFEMAEMLGSIEGNLANSTLGEVAQPTSKWIRTISNGFFKANGMQGWNDAMRVVATEAAVRVVTKAVKERAKDPTRYNELGLNRVNPQIKADGALDLNNVLLQETIHHMVEGSVARADNAYQPTWMNDPRWALVAHMRRFTYAFSTVILGSARHKMEAEGNYKPLATLAGAMSVVLAVDLARGAITGHSPMAGKGALAYMEHAAIRAGLTGRTSAFINPIPGGSMFDFRIEGGPAMDLLTAVSKADYDKVLDMTVLGHKQLM